MIEDKIVQNIIDAWNADQTHQNRGKAAIPLLSFPQLKTAIETIFFASLKKEEDRSIRLAVVLASPEGIGSGEHQSPDSILHFRFRLPFAVDTLAKLAPALDPARSAIAVGPTTLNGDLEVWGIFTFTPKTHRFNEISTAIWGEINLSPDLLTIYTKSPGSLHISRSNSQIGRVLNGEFIQASPTPFTSHSLGQYLIKSIEGHDLWKRHGALYWQYYRDALDVLLSEAASKGHGSTIVLLDQKKNDSCTQYFIPRYQFSERFSLERLIDSTINNRRDTIDSMAWRKLILEKIEVFAQFAAIDGAIILTSNLELIAFGTTLSAPPWAGPIVTGPDGFGLNAGNNFDPQRLGTRHNSAIAFAGACADSFVFVISQDGPVRAFMRSDNNEVVCWPDCTVSMFV